MLNRTSGRSVARNSSPGTLTGDECVCDADEDHDRQSRGSVSTHTFQIHTGVLWVRLVTGMSDTQKWWSDDSSI